jgi:hypothetical protein
VLRRRKSGALGDALLDATCFALGPPAGGVEQRRMFERKSASCCQTGLCEEGVCVQDGFCRG